MCKMYKPTREFEAVDLCLQRFVVLFLHFHFDESFACNLQFTEKQIFDKEIM